MAALTADDVTVTISQRNVEDRPGGLRHVIADLTFGDSSATYPTGGVPLPAIGVFGFKKAIAVGLVEQPVQAAEMYNWRYDRTNHTLMATGVSEYSTPTAGAKVLPEILSTVTPASVTIRMVFFGE